MSTLELYTKGARVWIPHKDIVWIGGELTKDIEDKVLEILLEDGREIIIDTRKSRLPPLRNPEILVGENDLTTLSYLNEPAVLYNLSVRFMQSNLIYTYCGIVLVAINPYTELPLYGPDIIAAYRGQSMGDMDPHVFAVAEDAFRCMSRDEKNQSIIVSGESGAGKTVSAKYTMRYFAAVGGASAETQIEKKVLASNPIMEAIGNAKTIRNDNSSRFGKYLEISFDKHHHIIGAHMRTYLLEKSRVVFQAQEERNYHIFYQLCASCDLPEMRDLRLGHPDDFSYLNQGDNPVIPNVDDADCLDETREAMDMVGIHQDDQFMLFRILAAILHLGNVEIYEVGENDECSIEAEDFHLAMTAELLGIDRNQLRKWLCNRKIVTVGEVLIKPLTASEANYGREAISKHIYSQLFKWVVMTINKTLASATKAHSFTGVLDIYGFETFETNSFEQFCINYANEKLQQQFTQHVFKLEQEEYVKEEIDWSFINFYDNQPCIDMIEAKLGILDLLDEECKMPAGSDEKWAQKLYKQHLHKANKHFSKPRMSNTAFNVHHFADMVQYDTNGFVEKNRDTVNEEHLLLLKASEYDLVAEVIQCTGVEMVGDLFIENEAQHAQRKRAHSRSGKNASKAKAKRTVGQEFSESLGKLMDTLNSTTPHYIRCIKPNDKKAPFEFSPKRSIQQLRACGVLETIRISAAGYPSRWTYPEFFARYKMLLDFKKINRKKPRETIKMILEIFIKDPDKFQLGKTKIFFRAGQVAYLEKLRSDKLYKSCVMIQKNYRRWRMERLYVRMKKAAIMIQSWIRGDQARRLARTLRRTKSAITVQRYWRGYRCRNAYVYLRSCVITIQSFTRGLFARRLRRQLLFNAKAGIIQRCWRGYKGRQKYRNYFKKIIYLQSCVRRMYARKELKKLKIEARSVEHYKTLTRGMENKVISLQQRLDEEVKKKNEAIHSVQELQNVRKDLEDAKQWKSRCEKANSRLAESEQIVSNLKQEIEKLKNENQEYKIIADEQLSERDRELKTLRDQVLNLSNELAQSAASMEREVKSRDTVLQEQLDDQKTQILAEYEAEKLNHQRVLRDYARLEQRYQNIVEELEIVQTSPQKEYHETGQLSTASSESSLVDDLEKDIQQRNPEEELSSIINKSKLVSRLREKIMFLENQNVELKSRVKQQSETSQSEKTLTKVPSIQIDNSDPGIPNDNQIVDSEKYKNLLNERDQLIEQKDKTDSEKKKMNNELDLLRKLVSQRNVDKEAEWEIIGEKVKEITAERDLLDREKTRLRDELVKMASVSKTLREIEELISTNPDESAYMLQAESLKRANNVLQIELEESYKKEKDLKEANEKLWREKAKLQRGRATSIHAMDSSFQTEVTRLVTENVELREQVERLEKELEDSKKDNSGALQPFRSRAQSIKDMEQKRRAQSLRSGQEPRAGKLVMRHAGLLRKSPSKEEDMLPLPLQIKSKKVHGMIEFTPEDEAKIIQSLILDMNPSSMSDAIPGLPAHILFMCIRHADHLNDDRCMQSLLGNSLNSIRKVVKKNPNNLEILSFWLANSLRLLHDMKQYSGNRWDQREPAGEGFSNMFRRQWTQVKDYLKDAFQSHNTPEQNEHCLQNFDLTEYRQVLSDLTIHVYQDLVKAIWDAVQGMIVPGLLEFESIPGVSSSKPFGGGRSRNNPELTVKSINKKLTQVLDILNAHCVDPEIIKQVFRQIFYYIGANLMNNLLLRKDMCHWSRGMQIRFNLSQLEDWVRVNQLDGSGIVEALEAITQATQLLQVNKKTLEDVDAICEVCASLNTVQVQKILSMYTPANEYEARVPSSVIKAVVERGHNKTEPMYLMMDTTYMFPVTLPFTPSAVSLETLQIPDNCGLEFLQVL